MLNEDVHVWRALVRAILLVTGTFLFASSAFAQVEAAAGSPQSGISADGRFVVFESTASNLTPGDTNNSSDIFVRDRQTGIITRVSVTSGGVEMFGASTKPSISADARIVAFVSRAPLVPEDTNTCAQEPSGPSCADVYVHDRTTGQTTRISVTSAGGQGDGASLNAHVSGDGRLVVFASDASNLVPGDTNVATDIFLHDRSTAATTRVSVSTDGTQANGPSTQPTISDDGRVVAFLTGEASLDPNVPPARCGSWTGCWRPFVRRLDTGVTTFARVQVGATYGTTVIVNDSTTVAVSRDGRALIGVAIWRHSIPMMGSFLLEWTYIAYRYDLQSGRTQDFMPRYDISRGGQIPAITADAGAQVIAFRGRPPDAVQIVDLRGTQAEPLMLANSSSGRGLALSADGLLLVLASEDGIVEHDRDPDHDGMPTAWETVFGLVNGIADGGLDPDLDGVTNADEYRAGTHPNGLVRRYFAEGVSNLFFQTWIQIYNPSASAARIVTSFDGDDGMRTFSIMTLEPRAETGFLMPADGSFATVLESDQVLAMTRTTEWGSGPLGQWPKYGMSAESAIEQPRTTWYFAEGATHGAFDLFYLFLNPTNVDAQVTVTYLRPSPLPPVVLTYPVAAHQRRTIWVDEEPGLGETDVAARIVSDQPIVVERSMYRSTPGVPFAAGTSAAGIPSPAAQWYVAEGATGDFFDLFLLLANPGATEAEVSVQYLLPDGGIVDKLYRVAPASRLTIYVDGEDPRLANTSVSAKVASLNAVGVIVERAMWWPSGQWYGGHVAAATTDASHRWGIAGARADGSNVPQGIEPVNTYLLVANPFSADATVTFSLTGTDDHQYGVPISCMKTVVVKGNSRFTSSLLDLCELPAAGILRMAGTIESEGAAIVAEESTYRSSRTEIWTAGSSTLLTRLP